MGGMPNSDGNVDLESNHDQQSEAARLSKDSFGRTDSNKMEEMSFRSNSNASVLSEATDDTSSFAPSPMHRLVLKKDVDDQELDEASMKKEFALLMLGGDISGGAKGQCPARAVSRAIMKHYSSTLGTYNKLEPLELEHRAEWRRGMNFYLAPCDQICDFNPGNPTEKMKVRSDIRSTLPILKSLEFRLLDIMDNFGGMDLKIKYAEPAPGIDGQKVGNPIPLSVTKISTTLLKKKRKYASQFFRAARALNCQIISEMDIPKFYKDTHTLPKTGKALIGEIVYRYLLSSAKFNAEELIRYLNFTTEEEAGEIVENLESAMVIWRGKLDKEQSKWKVVKDLVSDADKNFVLAKRVQETITCLKEKYPKLDLTSLDVSKIDNNTDMGKAIMESYSRVLATLACKIVTMIDETLELPSILTH